MGSFVGGATGRHVGDAVSIGCTGHAGVSVDIGVGAVEGVCDGVPVIITVGAALGTVNDLKYCIRVTNEIR